MADISTITLPNGNEYNLKDNNAIPSSEKAVASGVATLDANGLIPQSQMPGMVILSYGNNTWDDFLAAYQKNNIIYCRASSNSNPASGSQTRLAFMAYVNNATSPTEVEFQYYRSVSSHNVTQQGDQVYVYKLNKNNGWSVTVREAYTRITTSTGLTSSWSGGVLTEKAALVSETKLTNAATAATEVANRVYPVAVDVNGKLAVNVPWESGGSSLQWTIDNDGSGSTSLQATIQNDIENNIASGAYSHAEGHETRAYGDYSHAEGYDSQADGDSAHAEGGSLAVGEYSHSEGYSSATGDFSHSEGELTTASGYCSHAEGSNTYANHWCQHVFGEYNIADTSNAETTERGTYIEIVGKGTSTNARSNARTLDWSGNETLAGKLTVGVDPTLNMDVTTKQYVDGKQVYLTQAEYDALTPTQKSADVVYYITDADYSMPDVVTLSKAEYDLLPTEEKNNGLFYYVYDDTTTASTLVVQTNQDNANTVPSSKVLYDTYQDFLNYKDVISFDITLESSVVASCSYAKCVIKSGWAFISINNFVFKAAGNSQIIARGLPHAIYQAGATPSGTNASLTKTVVGDVAYLFPSDEVLRAHANTDSYNQAHWYYFSYPIDPSWTMPS